MNARRVTMYLLTAVAVVSCESEVTLDIGSSDVDVAAESAAIMALEGKWSDMYSAGDLDGITALLASNSILIASGEQVVVGADNVRRATETMLAAGSEGVSWQSDAAFVAPSGDMAYDYGTATTRLPDGSTVEGKYLVVWTREDGEWKIAADMFN